jgi:hypothetical protein
MLLFLSLQETKLKYEKKLLDLERFIKDVESDRDRLQSSLVALKTEKTVCMQTSQLKSSLGFQTTKTEQNYPKIATYLFGLRHAS